MDDGLIERVAKAISRMINDSRARAWDDDLLTAEQRAAAFDAAHAAIEAAGITTLLSRIDVLEGALRPFATKAAQIDNAQEALHPDGKLLPDSHIVSANLKDCRAGRQALTQPQSGNS